MAKNYWCNKPEFGTKLIKEANKEVVLLSDHSKSLGSMNRA